MLIVLNYKSCLRRIPSHSSICIHRKQDMSLTRWPKKWIKSNSIIERNPRQTCPIQIWANPTQSHWIHTEDHWSSQSANGLGLFKNLSAERRPYHSGEQEEGRQKTDATTVKRGWRRSSTHGFSLDGGQSPKCSFSLLLACSVPLHPEGVETCTHFSVTWPSQH